MKPFIGIQYPITASPFGNEKARPRVTVVSGFLGAGKTTLLRHLLTRPHGLRLALIVNDLNALNLDAALLADVAPAGTPVAAAESVVALSDGCICCSVRDALGDAVVELATSGDYDHILVEGSGVTSPCPVAELFFQPNAFGPRLEQVSTLHALVTVVDAVEWLCALQALQAPTHAAFAPRLADAACEASPSGTGSPAAHRPVFSLMVEQVECADVLVVNKTDLLTPGELGALAGLLRGLNPRAELHLTEHAVLPADAWPGPTRFDRTATFQGGAWVSGLNAGPVLAGRRRGSRRALACSALPSPALAACAPDYALGYGLGSFLFQRWRPVREAALRGFFERGWPGLLRVKGFVWTAEEP